MLSDADQEALQEAIERMTRQMEEEGGIDMGWHRWDSFMVVIAHD